MSNNNDVVRWEEFDKIHVIQRLKAIIGKWWHVQINFTDKKGFLRGVPEGKFFNPLNSICKAIVADAKGFSKRVATARKTTVDTMNSKKALLSRSHEGFSVISVPIHVNGEFMGTVFGDGFIIQDTAKEQRALINSYLERDFPDDKNLIKEIDKIPALSGQDVEYLTELVILVVDEILLMHKSLDDSNIRLKELSTELGQRYGFDQMIGKSRPMQELYRLLDRVCDSATTILIQGDNGTGKELIAKALHYNSKRRHKKFMIINCGAFNENLLESELFGHVKGSFTGAVKDKKGLFEAANGGTLFLDEVGDTSMQMQVKLLRVLQEGTYTPVGSTELKTSNVRVLAATNKDLLGMVRESSFREDLYYRLNVINIHVPSLKDRKEDIYILVDHFLERFAKSSATLKKMVNKSCMEKLMNHDWPGNVRELENEIERLCVLGGSETEITDDLLSPRIRDSQGQQYPGLRVNGNLKDAIDELEKQMILEGLERTGWNKSKLAKELGISRAGLISKVAKYELEKRKSS